MTPDDIRKLLIGAKLVSADISRSGNFWEIDNLTFDTGIKIEYQEPVLILEVNGERLDPEREETGTETDTATTPVRRGRVITIDR